MGIRLFGHRRKFSGTGQSEQAIAVSSGSPALLTVTLGPVR